jgi:hypothetical protein
MSTALIVWSFDQNNGTNVTVNSNATMANVSEVVGTTFTYVLVSLLFTYLSYMFIASSMVSYFRGDFNSEIYKGFRFSDSDKFVRKDALARIIVGLLVKWVLFIVGWSLYTGSVLGKAWIKPKPFQLDFGVPLSETDLFAYYFTAIAFGLMTWWDFSLVHKYRYPRTYKGFNKQMTHDDVPKNKRDDNSTDKEELESMDRDESSGFIALKVVLPTLTAAALVLFPGAYQFAVGNTTVINSGNGSLVAFNLATGLILTVILLLRAIMSSEKVRNWSGKTLSEDAPKRSFASTATAMMFQDVFLLGQKPEGLIKAATYGFMGGIYMPFAWILCHMVYTFACGFPIYQDGTRPWVWGIVSGVIPFLLTLKAQQWRTYLGFHAAMGGFFLILNILCASITGPLNGPKTGDTFAPVVTSFSASNGTYSNITLNKLSTQSQFFLVAQNPGTLSAMRPSTDFMSIGALVLAFTCFLLNLMYFDTDNIAPSVKQGKAT